MLGCVFGLDSSVNEGYTSQIDRNSFLKLKLGWICDEQRLLLPGEPGRTSAWEIDGIVRVSFQGP
jgi:hypothetical protein